MKRVLAAVAAALLMVSLVSSVALATSHDGNSPSARCQHNNWQTLVGTTGPFVSRAACVTYASHGGILYPKTASLTSVVTGPVAGLGALVGNPQSRVAGGIADPAMLFTLGGWHWVPGLAISLTYTAAAPLNYTYANPTGYFPTAPATTANGSGAFRSWFQDNCFDFANNLVGGKVHYTISGTNTAGQHASVSGILNCKAIPATVTATGNTLASDHPGFVLLTASGWHFKANAPISLTYSVLGTLDGLNVPLAGLFTEPTTGANGSFFWNSASTQLIGYYGDDCRYDTTNDSVSNPTLQTSDMTFTMMASDGTHTATATGILMCSLLAP